MSDPTFYDLISPGKAGDTEVSLRLTAREVAALQFLISVSVKLGVGNFAAGCAADEGVFDDFMLALRGAEARVGLSLAGALSPEHKEAFSAALARIEQERAGRGGLN